MANTPLTKQTTKITAVISYDKYKREQIEESLNNIKQNYLDPDCDMYGYIIHDKDFNKVTRDDGKIIHEPKTNHAHLVFKLKKRKRLSTIINDLASYGRVDRFAVTIDVYSSFEGCFQYLIHKNDPQKAQYETSEIVSNLSDDEIDMVLEANTKTIDFEDISNFVKEGHTLLELIDHCGISVYQHYRATINDIYKVINKDAVKTSLLQNENNLLRHELTNIYIGLKDIMTEKKVLLTASVPLKMLQEMLEQVDACRIRYGIGEENNPW